jgi:hypothetical protein
MSNSNVFQKDVNAVLDFGFDWSQWLAEGETILSYVVTPDEGITKVIDGSTTAGSVIVWLSSGSPGQRYSVACKITTSSSPARIDERTIKVDVRQR